MIFNQKHLAIIAGVLTLGLAWPVASFAQTAGAQSFADTPCDPVYFDSLKSRAWMEAQREITQNQNIIAKPDSVLELTCFDQFNNVLAKEAQNLFSETQRWGAIEGRVPGKSMGLALNAAVGDSLTTYTSTNFGNIMPQPQAIKAGSYTCANMANIWKDAKCENFASDANQGFFTLKDYALSTEDKRSECALLTTAGHPTERDSIWYIKYSNALTYPKWPEDTLKSYANLTAAGDCSTSVKIPTGVEVIHSQKDAYQEQICLMPGCVYTGPADGANCR